MAAWYPDPTGQAALRWWDGTQWTAHVREPPQYAPPAPSWQPGHQQAAVIQHPLRARFDEDQYRAWRKNSAATSALAFAAINVGFLIVSLYLQVLPLYRAIPSVVGVVASVVALRQALRTETGFIPSVVALVLNIVVGIFAAEAFVEAVSLGL